MKRRITYRNLNDTPLSVMANKLRDMQQGGRVLLIEKYSEPELNLSEKLNLMKLSEEMILALERAEMSLMWAYHNGQFQHYSALEELSDLIVRAGRESAWVAYVKRNATP